MIGLGVAGGATSTEGSYHNLLLLLDLFRLAVASTFLFLLITGAALTFDIGIADPRLFASATVAYLLLSIGALALASRPSELESTLLTMGVMLDVVAIISVMHASGGFKSGLAVLLLFSVAGAAVLADRTMTLFHAASASIGLLFDQVNRMLHADQYSVQLLEPGLLCVGYFVISIMLNALAGRVISSERVAVRRGRELENQLRLNELVIQDVEDGVIVLDDSGQVLIANRSVSRMIGVTLGPGTQIESTCPELADTERAWRVQPERPPAVVDLPITGRRARPRFVPVGEGNQVLVLIEDLSRQEERSHQLKLAALGRLTANIAHEIRNPLAAIMHAADLLAEDRAASGAPRLLEIIRDNGRRLDRLVSDVMQLARRDRANPEQIDLEQWVVNFASDFGHSERLPADALGLDLAPGVMVTSDPVHLNQIMWNLAHNAWRHGSGRPGSVRLVSRKRKRAVELDVRDDGPGIAPDLRTQIFEPFFTTFSKGTGLGLYIARELAQASGARLEFRPEEPQTTFRLIWPLDSTGAA